MKTQPFLIGRIPAVLYGEYAERLWLFLHGQMGHKEEAEAFAKIVCPKGAQVLGIDLPGTRSPSGAGQGAEPLDSGTGAAGGGGLGQSALGLYLPPGQQHRCLLCHACFVRTR